MNEEEKELIKRLENDIEALAFPSNLGLFHQGTLIMNIDLEDLKMLLNYISKLEKGNKQLKERNNYLEENDYSWHQLMKMQNKREYRSKFLKEFQAEFGKNVMPDYDEIYKRYDKQKELIKKLELDNQVLKETLYGGNISE